MPAHSLKRRCRILVLLPALLAGGASAFHPLADPGRYKSVAVVSMLPETVSMTHIGFTVFNNERQVAPVDWRINDVATAAARKLLGQRYAVHDLAVDGGAFYRSVEPGDDEFIPKYDYSKDISRRLGEILKPGTVDIVVVYDGTGPGSEKRLGLQNPGEGVILRSNSSMGGRMDGSGMGIHAQIAVYDGTSFALLAATSRGSHGRHLEFEWLGERYDSLPDATKAAIRSAALEMVPESLEIGFRDLGLVDKTVTVY